jgi:LL-diaminopimelate aminotransferase
MFELAERVATLPPYLFKEIDEKKRDLERQGADIIDLGVGDPDLPTPSKIIEAMRSAVRDPATHHYPAYSGSGDFKEAIAEWYGERFSVVLDPDTEVLSLIGAKEGIAHIHLAFLNPGDLALVPTPGYPVYNIGTLFADGVSYSLPLVRENGFLPELDSIPEETARKAKILWLNYPNNPTTGVANREFFEAVVAFAHKYEVMVCNDLTYSEIAFDGYRPPSLLEIEGAKEVAVEFHSLSKSFNMTGWRIGFAVGNKEAVTGLGTVKSNLDSGVFQAIQRAGVVALRESQDSIREIQKIYATRRDIVVNGLRDAGFVLDAPKATFYLWVPIPQPYTSTSLATKLLTEAGVVVTPGNGFGFPGEGYVRLALTQDESRLLEAAERIKQVGL